MIQGTVHRISTATSHWQSFDVAIKKNQEIWTENQYPNQYLWSSSISVAVQRSRRKRSQQNHPKMNNILKKLKVLTIASLNLGLLFNNKKATCLPTLKSPFDKNLKYLVVYKVTCNGCSSIYVGQTSQQVTTRFSEHQKKDSPVGQHLVECCDFNA